MPIAALFILSALFAFWLYAVLAGLKDPKRLVLLCIATISLINFSYFTGEVTSRIATPDILFLTLFFVCIIRTAVLKQDALGFSKGPGIVMLLLIAALFASLMSTPWDHTMTFGQGFVGTLMSQAVIFFLITQHFFSEDDLRKFLKAWVIAAILAAIVAAIDMGDLFSSFKGSKYNDDGFFGVDDLFFDTSYLHAFLSSYSFRIIGSFRNPGQLANFALTTFFILIAFSFVPKQPKRMRIFLWLLAGFLALCSVLTGRSSAFPSFVIGFLLVTLYLMFRSKKLTAILLSIFGLISLLSFAAIMHHPKIREVVISRNLESITNCLQGGGFLGEQARMVYHAFLQNPVFGIGAGRFIQSEYHEFVRGYAIHSTHMQFLAETGVLGVLAYFLFMGYFFVLAVQNVRMAWKTPWRSFYSILLIGLISMQISYLYNRHMKERTFWLYIALLFISYRLQRRNKKKQGPPPKTADREVLAFERRLEELVGS